jgi:hypothetical protein
MYLVVFSVVVLADGVVFEPLAIATFELNATASAIAKTTATLPRDLCIPRARLGGEYGCVIL